MKKRFKGRTFRIEKRRLYGVCDHGDAVITIDTRQRGKELLNTLVHECLHASNPDLSEAVVTRMANELADVLWSERYRKRERT